MVWLVSFMVGFVYFMVGFVCSMVGFGGVVVSAMVGNISEVPTRRRSPLRELAITGLLLPTVR